MSLNKQLAIANSANDFEVWYEKKPSLVCYAKKVEDKN